MTLRLSATTAVLGTLLAVAACKNDDAAGSGSDSDGTTTTGTTTSGASTSSTTAGTGSGTGASSGSTTGATEVRLFGLVEDRVLATPIPDAAVSVDGMPGFETTSDADGNYSIEGLPPQTEIFVIVDPSTDYYGSVVPLMTGDPGDLEHELAQMSFSFVDMWKGIIEMMGSMTLDQAKANVFVRVVQNSAVTEGPVTVDMTPPPVADSYFGPDANGNPVLNSSLAQWGLLPVVVFANLEPGGVGTYTIGASHPVRECTVPHPTFPTYATHLTLVDVDCPPAG